MTAAMLATALVGIAIAFAILLVCISAARSERADRHRGRVEQDQRHVTFHGNDF